MGQIISTEIMNSNVKKTETAASDIKIPKGEEISFLELTIIKHKIRFGSICFRAGRLRLYRNRFSLSFRTGIKKMFLRGLGNIENLNNKTSNHRKQRDTAESGLLRRSTKIVYIYLFLIK